MRRITTTVVNLLINIYAQATERIRVEFSWKYAARLIILIGILKNSYRWPQLKNFPEFNFPIDSITATALQFEFNKLPDM